MAPRMTEAQKRLLSRLWHTFVPSKAIAERMGTHESTVRRRARRLGLAKRKGGWHG